MFDYSSLIEQLQNFSLFANTGWDYTLALIIFIASLIGLKIIQIIILAHIHRIAQKTENKFDDVLIEIFKGLRPPFYVLVSLYIGFQFLNFPSIVDTVITVFFIIALVYEAVSGLEKIIDYAARQYAVRAKQRGEVGKVENQAMIRALQMIAKLFLWAIGILIILTNLGVNVTSLIAGLGVGGLAIALALKNILEDIFSSFSIYFDKPFEIGDTISVGDKQGKVEKIGLKTTHLRAAHGEQIIISNRELTSAQIKNLKRMETRLVKIDLAVEYGLTSACLKLIPKLAKEAVTKVDGLKFIRCNLVELGDYAIKFTLVYKVDSKDIKKHIIKREKVLLRIYTAFEREGIPFAYPTAVQLNRDE